MICYKKLNQTLILCSFWYIINMGDSGIVGIFKDTPTISDRYLVNTEKCVGKTNISIY